MKKTICVVTGSRADYGLLRPLIRRLMDPDCFTLRIAATGAHLSENFGFSFHELDADGIPIDFKLDVLQNDDSNLAMSNAIGAGVIGFAAYFDKTHPDLVVLLGDRFEIFAAATAAAVACIPIAHLHGGETTEGAADEFFRHSITKMSFLHFTSTEAYRQRVIRMGEAPDRVFHVGALGVENCLNLSFMTKRQLSQSIGFDLSRPYALVTFHPVTLEKDTAMRQMEELLSALDEVTELNVLFTYANSDAGGRKINKRIETYCKSKDTAIAVASLGTRRYLSAMKFCELVIGNSSSGILEAPSLKIPTVNIGDRQKGRICAASVLSCPPVKQAILQNIRKARSKQFRREIAHQESPYGDGTASVKIAAILQDFLDHDRMNLKKNFYDGGENDHA